MEVDILRFSSQKHDTLGAFKIDGSFACFSLEDEERTLKVYGETRIPEGRYKLGLRKVGGFHSRYSKRFPKFHVGMLQILDVPGFEYVLIHIGNDEDDTAGCILVGNTAIQNVTRKGFIGESTKAYERIYKKIVAPMLRGKDVFINVKNIV